MPWLTHTQDTTTPHAWTSSRLFENWASRLRDLIDERDALSCVQSGPRGPPFGPTDALGRALTRWLPWRWYSLDGTGWCYDTGWDELRRCEDVTTRVDWNGISDPTPPSAFGIPMDQLLLVLGVGGAVTMRRAYREWVACVQRRAAEDHEDTLGSDIGRTYLLDDWLRSGRAWPWRWERRETRFSLIGCFVGALAAVLVPLPLGASV